MINEYFILIVLVEILIICHLLNNWFKGVDMDYFNTPTTKDKQSIQFISKMCKKIFGWNPILELSTFPHLVNMYVKVKYCKKIY